MLYFDAKITKIIHTERNLFDEVAQSVCGVQQCSVADNVNDLVMCYIFPAVTSASSYISVLLAVAAPHYNVRPLREWRQRHLPMSLIGFQRFARQQLIAQRSVDNSCIEQRHAPVHRFVNNADALFPVGRLRTVVIHTHYAEVKSGHLKGCALL